MEISRGSSSLSLYSVSVLCLCLCRKDHHQQEKEEEEVGEEIEKGELPSWGQKKKEREIFGPTQINPLLSSEKEEEESRITSSSS